MPKKKGKKTLRKTAIFLTQKKKRRSKTTTLHGIHKT
jgi:hypothetical protein